MEPDLKTVNDYLVSVFNDILTIEESELKKSQFKDLSITEMHTIEAIGMYKKKTTSEVAKELSITVGTLTTAINKLVKKGYVERIRSEDDRRVVKLGLTKKGKLLFRVHQHFPGDRDDGRVAPEHRAPGRPMGRGLRAGPQMVGPRLCHRGAVRRAGLLVRHGGRAVAGRLPRQRERGQRRGAAEGGVRLRPRRDRPQI